MAAKSPRNVKEASVVAAIATPATTSTRLNQACFDGTAPRNAMEKAAVKNGSAAHRVREGNVHLADRDVGSQNSRPVKQD
eukprot:CAMPEP_0115139774 /NCGR_PEP_ID=MMETSP0227-20121206/58499_1 /TAXON_ID=89957 /ORGANISM="Polarella glacialis, Strain CCMP 1383" /LENGTH=79 /DNA_ID=CAMNT_0002547723 /DNA_START=433 /DNA_END=673 /DNA_ORIENTATION=-